MMIRDRAIGSAREPYVIAEIGVNHDGSPERALALVDAAADAGADAVKTQFFEAERLMSRAARLAAYQTDAGERDPIEMLRRLELSLADMARVIDRAHARALHAIVTVFSVELVAPAARLPWDAFKTASPDIVNKPLLDALAHAERPMIVSTGAAEMDEVRRAALWLDALARLDRLAILQCVSAYPTRDEDAAIGGVGALSDALGLPTGYSDHTAGVDTGALAVEHGACILEKHLTWSNAAPGPDHAASLEPDAFAEYARLAREAPAPGRDGVALARERTPPARSRAATMDPRVGPAIKRVLPCERDVRAASRQSLVAARAIAQGQSITRADLTVKRPGSGLAPFMLDAVVGRTAARAVRPDTPLTPEDFA